MPDSTEDRELEATILGSLLIDNALIEGCASIQAQDFCLPAHRLIYEAIRETIPTADLVTVTQKLIESGDLERCGGPEYVSGLVDGIPFLRSIRHYGEILLERSTRRRLALIGHQIQGMSEDLSVSAEELLAKAEALIYTSRDRAQVGLYSGEDLVELELADSVARTKEASLGAIKLGFPKVDYLTQPGLQRGAFWVVGARPSVGKTSFLTGATAYAVRRGKKVLHIACEMGRLRNAWRLFAASSRVPLRHIAQPKRLTPAESANYLGALNAWSAVDNFLLAYYPRPTSAQIKSLIRRAKDRLSGLDLVVLDYVQKVRPSRRRGQLFEERTDVAQELVAITGEEDVTLLCGCQLNREAESDRREDRPQKSELKGTGALEEEATGVILLHRWGILRGATDRGAEIIVAKQQDGPTGVIEADFEETAAHWTAEWDEAKYIPSDAEGDEDDA